MPKASVLQFHNYEVEEMVYRAVPVSEDRHEFELRPQFDHNVIELGEGNYDVRLSFSLRPTEEYPMPFELKVSMVGHFTYQEQEGEDAVVKDHILQENTVSILFPFLRSIVAALTSNANIPTLMLPVMNFTKND